MSISNVAINIRPLPVEDDAGKKLLEVYRTVQQENNVVTRHVVHELYYNKRIDDSNILQTPRRTQCI